MSIRDILVIVTESKQAGPLYAAELLGAQWKAHIAALYASRMPDPVEGGLYFSGSIWAQAVNDIRKAAAADRQKLASRLAALEPPVELRHEEVVLGLAEDVASRHAMHADLTLLEQPRDGVQLGSVRRRAVQIRPARAACAAELEGWRHRQEDLGSLETEA